jgi:hypothetical protein
MDSKKPLSEEPKAKKVKKISKSELAKERKRQEFLKKLRERY